VRQVPRIRLESYVQIDYVRVDFVSVRGTLTGLQIPLIYQEFPISLSECVKLKDVGESNDVVRLLFLMNYESLLRAIFSNSSEDPLKMISALFVRKQYYYYSFANNCNAHNISAR